jgi:prepilin-type N-terminal cleavage/methylation domain-containing protein
MTKRLNTGFTIVELLIVIVVIGILAAITIVAYRGIQDRARTTTVTSALSQAARKLATYQADNPDAYPADKTELATLGVKDTESVTYQYTRTTSTPVGYCITATNGTTSYTISNTSTTAQSGACAGHGSGGVAAMTNYAANPTAAGASAAAFGYAGSPVAATRTIASDQSHHGTTSLKTAITGASGQTGAMARPPTNSLQVNLGEKIRWSMWIYSTKAGTITPYIEGSRVADSTYTGASSGTVAVPANAWTKATGTYTAPMDMRVSQAGAYNLSVVAGDTVWFDEFLIERGDILHNYADGETANWVWNGAADNSTSTGPPQ